MSQAGESISEEEESFQNDTRNTQEQFRYRHGKMESPLQKTPQNTQPIKIALAGNPNSGKTTAFNEYTGSRQHVGNYPGVTVEKKEGSLFLNDTEITLIDLPGTYSLTAYSPEELVTRSVLSRDTPLAVLDIVDASALERNLMLTVQIMEMGIPVVLALNMMDEARKAGIQINIRTLGKRMGIPVQETVARTGEGLKEALTAALDFGRKKTDREPLRITYGSDLDPVLDEMEKILAAEHILEEWYCPRWIAVKVLECDEYVWKEIQEASLDVSLKLEKMRDEVGAHIRKTLNVSTEAIVADYRYGYICGLLSSGVIKHDEHKDRMALTYKLDKVFTNALLGPLIMLAVLYVMFQITFDVGAYPQGWIEDVFSWIGELCEEFLPDGFLKSLIVSGIIDGVGGVVSFVPLIMIMFLFVSFLEDSGYMSRIAYMVDRVFRAFGLHGYSVMPYIVAGGIAGGCAIPGVMATRTLRSPREKLATMLTLPYMTCGAKLPLFLLITGVFFQKNEAIVMFMLTVAGWIFALVIAKILRSTIIRGPSTPFVMELPPYRLPLVRSLIIHCWERTWMYLKKAGTVLVVISILIWAGMTFPQLDNEEAAPFDSRIEIVQKQLNSLPESAEERILLQKEMSQIVEEKASAQLRHSIAGRIGTAIEPLTHPAGFDWRTNIAMLAGIAAKEAVVATLGTAYSLGEQNPDDAAPLAERIANDSDWSKATGLALMLFVLLYSPCFVTLVVIRQEAGNWGWVAFSMLFSTAIAYLVAVTAYQIGSRVWG